MNILILILIILKFKSIHGLVLTYLCDEITMQRDIAVRATIYTINNNVHVPHITLECCKMHLPIEVAFYGMRFQKILASVNRSMVFKNVSNYP